jgi:predicted Zn-dependent peptidase
LLVVGDTTLSEVADLVEKHFARSPAASREGDRPDGLDHSASHAERLTVVDRPGSAQSVLRIGCRSVPRKHPDYFALLILNTVLGGQFSSRLNLNLREEKGYTYGARSSFVLRRFGGSFVAGADVQSSATSAAVEEFLREIAATTGRRPIDDRELSFAKAYLTRRFPARFETNGGVAAHLAQLAIYDLPDDYYSHYLANIERVSREQILEAAQRHLKPSSMRVVVVGDAQHTDGLAETVAQLSEVP